VRRSGAARSWDGQAHRRHRDERFDHAIVSSRFPLRRNLQRRRVTDNTDPNHQADITVWTYNALNQNIIVTVPGQGTTLIDNDPVG